jgi:hypothetical protein
MKQFIILTSFLCGSVFISTAQKVDKYWTVSTTPFSGLNPDPYFGLSLGRTTVATKQMWQINLGYAYRGLIFGRFDNQFEKYGVNGTISSLDYQIGIDESFYVAGHIGAKYLVTKATEWQTSGSGQTSQLITLNQKKVKGNLAFLVGAKTKVSKTGFCYDVSAGVGMSARQFYKDGVAADQSYFSDASIEGSGALPFGSFTVRIGYRVPPKK